MLSGGATVEVTRLGGDRACIFVPFWGIPGDYMWITTPVAFTFWLNRPTAA
jgi:hypothetical protein